jgi:hypothetical protein
MRTWTLVVLVLGTAVWPVLCAAVYDPNAWLIPIDAPTAAVIATVLVVPSALIVWLLGLAVWWAGKRLRRSASGS